jgi:photosystem II stability/assembly factor-like uncharacterized protein
LRRLLRGAAALLLACALGACGAPPQTRAPLPPVRAYDHFQGAAARGERVVVVGSNGVVLLRTDGAWQRLELPGSPELIDVVACGEGYAALAFGRAVWTSVDGERWAARPIPTEEETLALACGPGTTLWVGGSYATLWWSADGGASWQERTLEEDAQITAIQFVDAATAYAGGELGLLLRTDDGGMTWQRLAGLPEIYVQDLHFTGPDTGYVASAGGVVLHTADGGASWQPEGVPTGRGLFRFARIGDGLYLAGEQGALLRRDPSGWAPVDYGPPVYAYLRALAGRTAGSLVVAGGHGALREAAPGGSAP